MTTENDLEFAAQKDQTQLDKIQGDTKVEIAIRQNSTEVGHTTIES